MTLIKDIPLNHGLIICKCNLIDCVKMTDNYVNEIKNNPIEYTCGEYKEERYAWILDDIKILNKPIPAKGHLGIWNYESSDNNE